MSLLLDMHSMGTLIIKMLNYYMILEKFNFGTLLSVLKAIVILEFNSQRRLSPVTLYYGESVRKHFCS